MEPSRSDEKPDQDVDPKPKEQLTFKFNQSPKGTPLPRVDGTQAWEFMYDLQEVRDLI